MVPGSTEVGDQTHWLTLSPRLQQAADGSRRQPLPMKHNHRRLRNYISLFPMKCSNEWIDRSFCKVVTGDLGVFCLHGSEVAYAMAVDEPLGCTINYKKGAVERRPELA